MAATVPFVLPGRPVPRPLRRRDGWPSADAPSSVAGETENQTQMSVELRSEHNQFK